MKRLFRNAALASVQAVVSAALMFVLYGFVVRTLGIEKFGIWSLVLAVMSAGRISDLGISGGVVKFVAAHRARNESVAAGEVLQTAVITIGTTAAVLLVVLYPALSSLLSLVLGGDALLEGLKLLPYALMSLWLAMVASLLQSGLDGCHRVDIRTVLQMCSEVLLLAIVVVAVPRYDLMALAYAQIAQGMFLLVSSWYFCRREFPLSPIVPIAWRWGRLKPMLGYGVNLQVIFLMRMGRDPVAKVLLSGFGGVAAVGYFQMANRMIVKARSLLMSANQAIVPVFADAYETEPHRIGRIYKDVYDLAMYLALPFFGALIASVPLVSIVWLGSDSSTFVVFAIVLAAGWFVNTTAGAAYYSTLGTGELTWNLRSHVAMALVNIVGGCALGLAVGALGVVVAYAVALVVGGLLLVASQHMRHGLRMSDVMPVGLRVLGATAAASVLLGFGMSAVAGDYVPPVVAASLSIGVFCCCVGPVLWRHPMRTRLVAWGGRALARPGSA